MSGNTEPIIVHVPHDFNEMDMAAAKERLEAKFNVPVVIERCEVPEPIRMPEGSRPPLPRSALASYIGDIFKRPPAVAPVRVKCKYQRKLLGLDP